jgi:peptide/nickel transport system permease protein
VLIANPAVIFAISYLVVLVVAGSLNLRFDPMKPNPANILRPPDTVHWFGTDGDGFDVFSRTIAAARRDLPLAIVGTLLSLVIGSVLGLIASSRGRGSELMMRGLDVFQAFPLVILAVALVSLAGNRLENVVIAIVVINVPRFMRIVRAETLSVRESRFVEAARAIGASPRRVMFRHMLPNVMDVIVAQASLAVAYAIVVIAALGFLGVGVSPPEPTWGLMIQAGARQMTTGQWWVVAFPGLAVLTAVASFNLIADAQLRHVENSSH